MKTKKFLILWLCFSIVHLRAEAQNSEITEPPIFVSLGSNCEVAAQISLNGRRSVSYPFDWLVTCDYHGLILAFEDQFAFFMDRACLTLHPVQTIINTRYNIDFRHDWPEMDFDKYFPEVQKKYERRIERFKNLNNYKGWVFFVRAALDAEFDFWIPYLPTLTPKCAVIDNAQVKALKNSLVKMFPDLMFCLIVINYVEEGAPNIEQMDHVREFKIRKKYKNEDYAAMLQLLSLHQ